MEEEKGTDDGEWVDLHDATLCFWFIQSTNGLSSVLAKDVRRGR